jgi:ribosomal protein L44E
MILLFGLRTKNYRVSVLTLVCEVCGVPAAQTLLRRATKFTLFFVPLFPVRRSTYHLECSHCGALRAVDQREVARLAG